MRRQNKTNSFNEVVCEKTYEITARQYTGGCDECTFAFSLVDADITRVVDTRCSSGSWLAFPSEYAHQGILWHRDTHVVENYEYWVYDGEVSDEYLPYAATDVLAVTFNMYRYPYGTPNGPVQWPDQLSVLHSSETEQTNLVLGSKHLRWTKESEGRDASNIAVRFEYTIEGSW